MKTTWKGILCLCLALALQNYSTAQDKLPLKFGKISPEDFDLSKQSFDTAAGAVYIADVGSSEFEGNSKGWFSLRYKRQARIKILNKTGYDLANISIPLYMNGDNVEKLDNLKAVTYQLEDGKVTATKLDEKTVFQDKVSKNRVIKKFTLPAIREGCIIEFSYTILSDFLFNLQPWDFQGGYPRLWSEYTVHLPSFFDYVFLSRGYHTFSSTDKKESRGVFGVTIPGGARANEYVTLTEPVFSTRWVMKNVPALKEEPYTTSLENHLSKIEFQLSRIALPNSIPENVMGDWKKVTEALMKDEDFGASLAKANNWLDDDLKTVAAAAVTPTEKVQKLYAYVRDNFTCVGPRGLYLSAPLKNTFKSKSGGVADINLLLISMLRHEGLQADPVLLSTRSHGYTHEIYPLMDRFNYVVAKVTCGDQTFFLDASTPRLGFNHLPPACYNGHSRVIGDVPEPVYFDADSVQERKATSIAFSYDEKGKYSGQLISNPGFYESLGIRERIAAKGQEAFFKEMKTGMGSDVELSQLQVDSLTNFEQPVKVKYKVALPAIGTDELIYFNPMLGEGYKNNLFKSAERKYPVEMPYAMDETFVLNMIIPEGYVVDEIPKSARVALNDDEGSFEYIVNRNEAVVQLRSRIKLNKANFTAEDYDSLRQFFDYVVKKHSEQIVFKKKK